MTTKTTDDLSEDEKARFDAVLKTSDALLLSMRATLS